MTNVMIISGEEYVAKLGFHKYFMLPVFKIGKSNNAVSVCIGLASITFSINKNNIRI